MPTVTATIRSIPPTPEEWLGVIFEHASLDIGPAGDLRVCVYANAAHAVNQTSVLAVHCYAAGWWRYAREERR